MVSLHSGVSIAIVNVPYCVVGVEMFHTVLSEEHYRREGMYITSLCHSMRKISTLFKSALLELLMLNFTLLRILLYSLIKVHRSPQKLGLI